MSRPVPTVREFLSLVVGVPLLIAVVVEYRAAALSWFLSLPAAAFAWLAAFGAALALGGLIVGVDTLVEWFAIRNARKQGARHV